MHEKRRNVETSKCRNVETSKVRISFRRSVVSELRSPQVFRRLTFAVVVVLGAGLPLLGSDVEYEQLRATQEMFHAVAVRVRPYLVGVETVGGAQPRVAGVAVAGSGRLDEDDDGTLPKPRPPNPFRDTPGSSFVIADGPTTGIVYTRDGYIITSSFNFAREPALISVRLADGRRLAADLVARDQVRKIALLKVDASNLSVPDWAEVGGVRVGQWAIALGLGFGGDDPSVTVGIISALNRMHGNAIQTDAKLSPANYGGPLCDLSGKIVGICVPMAHRPGELAGVEMYDSGVGFVIPKRRVDEIVAVLMQGRSIYRGWLGMVADSGVTTGVVVANLADPSPLRRVGIQIGDKILSAEGRDIHNFGQLVKALYLVPAGEEIYLHLERDGIEFGVKVTLARSIELGALPEIAEPETPTEPEKP